jgi:hypothetical protein
LHVFCDFHAHLPSLLPSPPILPTNPFRLPRMVRKLDLKKSK